MNNKTIFRILPIIVLALLAVNVCAQAPCCNTSKPKVSSDTFLFESQMPWIDLGGGVSRQVWGYNNDIMMVKVKFKKGAIGAVHSHVHSQTSYVVSGVFELTIDGVTKTLRVGDGFKVEPNVKHGAVCIEAGVLIDVFNPCREDFLKK